MHLNLIKRGRKAGKEDLIKITKTYLFSLPIVLLVLCLCNAKCGPAFLQAVLSVLHENADRATPQILIHDRESDCNWGHSNMTTQRIDRNMRRLGTTF